MPTVTLTPDADSDGEQRRAANADAIGRFFDCMCRKDIDAWIDLWDDDARILVPYPPQGSGFPPSIEGREVILPGFQQLFAHFTSYNADVRTIYPSLDPDVFIVEWSVEAHLIEGLVYRGDNITVFRFDHGKLRSYHDYFNPELFRSVVETTAATSTSVA
jgi:ketosteroid isomerase-like protein